MRFTITLLLINLLATGLPIPTLPESSQNRFVAETHVHGRNSMLANDAAITELNSTDHLKALLPQENELVLLKILNTRNEVIAKWQDRSRKVLTESIAFLEKASIGVYRIDKTLKDGQRVKYIYRKL